MPPAMGERNARWGYGYQDKAATERIIQAIKAEERLGGPQLEGVRLADVRAGRVDDFVLVREDRVEGNSIKWRSDGAPMGWAELLGANGLLKELADGYLALKERWSDRTVRVRLQTSYAPSESKRGRLVRGLSVAEFVRDHWRSGVEAAESEEVRKAWRVIESHTGLQGRDFEEFVAACELSLGVPEAGIVAPSDEDSRQYAHQFDRLHKALATWITNHPTSETFPREFLLDAIGIGLNRSDLVQTFPQPGIPYRRNSRAAHVLREMLHAISGGYVAVSGCAGGGKSTLVQDVLTANRSFVLVPYFAFLPDGEGLPRDRGEALNFYRSVVSRLDRVFPGRSSLGIDGVAHGREALRRHMASAHESFAEGGRKTVLLVDGLDHVQKERGIRESILQELPSQDEIPSGFLIVLSGRPEAFLADAIGPEISGAVVESGGRRVVVDGLSKGEVYEIALESDHKMSAEECDRLYEDSQGNPLILTYLLNGIQGSGPAERSAFDGDIDRFYRSAFAVPLENFETRRILGLLSRAAPNITSRWLRTWPERAAIENLYQHVLAPFMREEDGHLRFLHSSLISFLLGETRSRLPDPDHGDDETSYYSDLADRTAGRSSSDALGRAHVFHLVRAGRLSDVLTVVTSPWLREAVRGFVAYQLVRPTLLEALRVAWDLEEYGHVVRLVLLNAELAQRSAHLDSGELSDAFLKLNDHEMAIMQVRANGMILANDQVALAFARKLWFYADAKEPTKLREMSRRLYADAKPVGHLLGHGPLRLERHGHEMPELLGEWCATAPLFEPIDEVVDQVRGLNITAGADEEELDGESVKVGFLVASLRTVIRAKVGMKAECSLLEAISATNQREREFEALLEVAFAGQTPVSPSSLLDLWGRCETRDSNLALGLACWLDTVGESEASMPIVEELAAGVFGSSLEDPRRRRDVDVSFIASLTYLCEQLGVHVDDGLQVDSDRDEAFARVETASRRLGRLRALACQSATPDDLRDRFREVLFYESRMIMRPKYDRFADVVMGSRQQVVGELLDVAQEFGAAGMRALRDVVLETARSGPFLGCYRRQFALAFQKARVLSREEAVHLGLTWTEDAEDEDPRMRQEACLEIAAFLHRVGDKESGEWVRRAGYVSAGAGSHKDYRMANLAMWLDEAIGAGPASTRDKEVIGKFLRTLEVSGGDGLFEAAQQVLQVVLRTAPECAASLAVEMIDRDLIGLASILEALVIGGAHAGASPDLLSAVFEELLSLIALDSVGAAAAAVVDATEGKRRVAVAERLMSRVCTNCLPSARLRIARDIQDALGRSGCGDIDLAVGLPPSGSDVDGRLYRLVDGRSLTTEQVASWLRSARAHSDWNPNPDGNEGYHWLDAVRKAGVLDVAILEAILTLNTVESYRESETLAARSLALGSQGDLKEARALAEHAIAASRDVGWFVRWDGGQRQAAYQALRALDAEEGVNRSRKDFGEELTKGDLNDYFVTSELPGIFHFLEIPWPKDAVLEIVEDFLDEVLAASRSVDPYRSLSTGGDTIDVDQAIIRFLVGLLALPAVEVALAARRTLASCLARGRFRFIGPLVESGPRSDIELEHLLIAIDVACRQNRRVLTATLRPIIQSLNMHESLAVRHVARRICDRAGWEWVEIRNRPKVARLHVPTIAGRVSRDESGMFVGGDIAAAWGLFEDELRTLEGTGVTRDGLASEFANLYARIGAEHRWSDVTLAESWKRSSRALWTLRPRVLVGRAATMRLVGGYQLEGTGPVWDKTSYDWMYPLYDPVLELHVPAERPVELRALEWKFRDAQETAWAQGEGADHWEQYPQRIENLHLIGEVSHFVKPDMEACAETRIRGILATEAEQDRNPLLGRPWVTHAMYLRDQGIGHHQVVACNGHGLLQAGVYRWVALNARLAERLGWVPSSTGPFAWQDPQGQRMVTSIYWRDGWTGVDPPRLDVLGEGWCLLATDAALQSIRQQVRTATVHLSVRRQRLGRERLDESWKLQRPL